MAWTRYDPYTDRFITDNNDESNTATISTAELAKPIIQLNVVNVSDDSIDKIADAVLRKLADRKTEPITVVMPKAHGRKQALQMIDEYDLSVGRWEAEPKDEPQTDCAWK